MGNLFLFGLFVSTSFAFADSCEFIRQKLNNPKINEVVIPAGTYVCKTPIVVNRDGVELRGAAPGKVTLKLAPHTNCPLIVLGKIESPIAATSNLKLSDLILYGDRQHQDMECWGGKCGSGGHSGIRNNGVTVRMVHGAEIKNVEIHGMRSGGIVTEIGCTNLHVDGLKSTDNYFDGLAGYQTTASLFENMDLSENMAAGISIDLHFDQNTFRNVAITKNFDVGIFMRDSFNDDFENFQISDGGSYGVFVSQADSAVDTCPSGNTFGEFVFDGGRSDAFHLNTPCTGNTLVHPKFSNIHGQEIYEPQHGLLKIIP